MEASIVEGISDRDKCNRDSGSNADGILCIQIGLCTGLAWKLRISTVIKSLQSECSSIRDVGPEFGQESSHIRLVGKFRDKPRHSKLISGLSSGRGRNVIQFLEARRCDDSIARGRGGSASKL